MSSVTADAVLATDAAVAAVIEDVKPEDMFRSIGTVADGVAEGDGAPQLSMVAGDVMTLKSLCPSCEDQGETKVLLTRIPFFRDVILMAFECEHCGCRNSEVQSAEVQPKGCRFEVTVRNAEDMDRQLVKSDRATVLLPELEFEIPPNTQKGVFTTIEGLLDRAIENLQASQDARRAFDAASAEAVGGFLVRLQAFREGQHYPFKLVLDDPSGNSFLENPIAPKQDPGMHAHYYTRTEAQNHELGCYAESAHEGMTDADGADGDAQQRLAGIAEVLEPDEDDGDTGALAGSAARTIFPAVPVDRSGNVPSGFRKGGALITTDTARGTLTSRNRRAGVVRGRGGEEGLIFDSSSSDAAKEVMRFPVDCFHCSTHGECRMCVTDVPHFKEVIIMSFTCEACGWRNVEVKGGGAVPAAGTLTELHYNPSAPDAERDMTRDVIKSDTSALEVPEIELHLEAGSLGGMYTTVEGLLTAARDTLLEGNPFSGDSATEERAGLFRAFIDRFNACIEGRVPFTLRLKDPMANTWVYSPTAPAPDPRLTHVQYTRSHEEDLDLGLLDMNAPEGTDAAPAAAEPSSGGNSLAQPEAAPAAAPQ